jgi:hypothetical protein
VAFVLFRPDDAFVLFRPDDAFVLFRPDDAFVLLPCPHYDLGGCFVRKMNLQQYKSIVRTKQYKSIVRTKQSKSHNNRQCNTNKT